MKNLKIIVFVTFAVLISLILILTNTRDHNKVQGVFNIGVTLPLSGDLSMYGDSILNGLKMGIEERNVNGPIKLNLIISDNKGDTKIAVGDVKRFVDVNNVVAVVNAMEHLSFATRGVIDEAKIPMLMSTTYTLKERDNPRYLFRDYWDFNVVGKNMGEFLVNRKVQSIKILAQNDNSYVEFKNAILEKGINLKIEERFNFDNKDFRSSISKMEISSDDTLVVYAYPVEASLIIKQLNELNIYPRYLLITEATEYPTLSIKSNVKYLSDVGAISYTSSMLEDDYFVSMFKKKYNSSPRVDSFYAYQDGQILYDSIAWCFSGENVITNKMTNSNCLISKLESFDFDSNHNKIRNIPLVKFEGEGYVLVE